MYTKRLNWDNVFIVVGLGLILMFSGFGCKVQDLEIPTNPGAGASAPAPEPEGEITPASIPQSEDAEFTFENIDYWYYADRDYQDYAFDQYVTGSAVAPLYYHMWSKWDVGHRTLSHDEYESPNEQGTVIYTLVCIEDDTQRARANLGLSYTIAGFGNRLADPAVAARNANYDITSEVVSLSPITCRFRVRSR